MSSRASRGWRIGIGIGVQGIWRRLFATLRDLNRGYGRWTQYLLILCGSCIRIHFVRSSILFSSAEHQISNLVVKCEGSDELINSAL